jgi:hypothetical protein
MLPNHCPAAQTCGVSPSTILRWENEGKIHPFITSGNTYYPRTKLIEKLDELKQSYTDPAPSEPEPVPLGSDLPSGTVLKRNPRVPLEEGSPAGERTVPNGTIVPILTNALITLVLILTYHFFFNTSSAPASPTPSLAPTSGAVQGVQAPDPKLDLLEQKLLDHLADDMLKDAKPLPVTTINLDNTSFLSGTATLPKGKDQISVTNDKITPLPRSPPLLPAISACQSINHHWSGSFTHTDFPTLDSIIHSWR